MAIAELLGEGGYDRHLRRLRTALALQSERYRNAIAEAFPPGTRVSKPQGGFVLWVELATGFDAIALQRRALERGIAIAPGSIFSARRRFGHCLRMSTGQPMTPRIERAIATLGELTRIVTMTSSVALGIARQAGEQTNRP